jgi:hypothetical protein
MGQRGMPCVCFSQPQRYFNRHQRSTQGGGIALSQDVRVGRPFFGDATLGEFVRQPLGWSWCEDPSPGPIRGNQMKTINFITTLVALSQDREVRQAMLPSSGRRAWLPQRAVNEWFK